MVSISLKVLALNADGFHIVLQQDLVPGQDFLSGENMMPGEKVYVFLRNKLGKAFPGVEARLYRPLFFRLRYPFLGIAVSVEIITFLCFLIARLMSSWTACSISSGAVPFSSSANWDKASATAVFRMILGVATEAEEPSMRNSNLFPVKAKGEVRFRSVLSFTKWGST